jgi:hypothetical protein
MEEIEERLNRVLSTVNLSEEDLDWLVHLLDLQVELFVDSDLPLNIKERARLLHTIAFLYLKISINRVHSKN